MNWCRVGVFHGKISYVNGASADEQAVEEALKLTGTQEFAHLPVENSLVGSASVAGLRWCWRKRRLISYWMNPQLAVYVIRLEFLSYYMI